MPAPRVDGVRDVAGVRSAAVEERGQAQLLLVQVEPGAEVDLRRARAASTAPASAGSARAQPTLEDAYVALVAPREDAAAARGVLLAAPEDDRGLGFDGIFQVIWPLFFATMAFLLYGQSEDQRVMVYAGLGRP